MRVLLRDHLIVRISESADEKSGPDGWRAAHPTPAFFATAPFELDGQWYQSVESFWQSLKFGRESERRHLPRIEGARAEGEKQGYGPTITYRGQDITVGTRRHWQLVERACRAEFAQNPEAAEALLATGQRPLTHVVRRDSTTIPGVMAAIWMRIGKDLTNAAPVT
jgi:predicted NAD-dependent protein-ADP-ribosyltransferase YbiA (DUF1768 family)